MIYLYAIVEPGGLPPPGSGLDDQPLSVLDAGMVAGLFSRHERERFEAEPQALWRHDRVVEAAMDQGPVLPARFGSTFPDTDALAAAVQRDEARLNRQLERVRGCVELAVRASLPADKLPAPHDGREYLRLRMARRQESRAVAQTLEPLDQHAVLSHHGISSGDAGAVTASYLIRAADVDRFAGRVRELARDHMDLSLSCTGPWPPYSFVGEAA